MIVVVSKELVKDTPLTVSPCLQNFGWSVRSDMTLKSVSEQHSLYLYMFNRLLRQLCFFICHSFYSTSESANLQPFFISTFIEIWQVWDFLSQEKAKCFASFEQLKLAIQYAEFQPKEAVCVRILCFSIGETENQLSLHFLILPFNVVGTIPPTGLAHLQVQHVSLGDTKGI